MLTNIECRTMVLLRVRPWRIQCLSKNLSTPPFQTLQPTVFDSGRVINDDVSSLVHKIEREIRSVRTVTHTTTSSWKYSHELGIEISYSPPGATGDILFTFPSLYVRVSRFLSLPSSNLSMCLPVCLCLCLCL